MNHNPLIEKPTALTGTPGLVGASSIFIAAVLLCYRVLLIFSFSGELTGIDNNFVYDVSRTIEGIGPYTHPANAPYAITLYSPLYFNICGLVGKLLSIDPDDAINVYRLCRSVSLLADLTTCFLLFSILKQRFQVTGRMALFAVAIFACILCKLAYTFSRSDSFMLAFYAAVIYLLTARGPRNFQRLFLLSIFSVGAILSKQNGILIPVLVSTWFLLMKEKKALLYYLTSCIILCVACLIAYRAVYPFLFPNTITALQNRIDIPWFYAFIFKRSMDSLWILPLYFATFFSIKLLLKPAETEDKALSAMFILQLLFAGATSLKWGSSVSYFYDSFLLSLVILFRRRVAAGENAGIFYTNKVALITLPLVLFFLAHTVIEGYLFFLQNNEAKKAAYLQQKEIRQYLRPRINGGYVLSLADPNRSFFKTLFYKEIAVPNVDMVDCCTLPDGNFDYTLLKNDLANGHIQYLITGENEKPDTIWGVPLDKFVIDTSIHQYAIYSFTSHGAHLHQNNPGSSQ